MASNIIDVLIALPVIVFIIATVYCIAERDRLAEMEGEEDV